MSNIIPFAFSGHNVRVIQKDGEPLFVGKDVCEALGYSDGPGAIKKHCKGSPKWLPLQTDGGKQRVRLLTEGDVMRLIVRSKLPAAQDFESLVFDTILPTIRRTGYYNPVSEKPLTTQVTGGIMRGVILKALRQEAPDIFRSIMAGQGFSLVENYKTANEWLKEYGAHKKGRSGLTRRIGNALKRLCEDIGVAPHRCAISGKWLYPAEVARPFMRGTGGHWIRMHNALIQDNQSHLAIYLDKKAGRKSA